MEMKPEDLKKYNERHPPLLPKHGRYAPHGQFFLCDSADQVAKLEAAGWNTNPFLFDPPYAPEDAKHIEKWRDVKLVVEVAPSVPDVDEAAVLRAELEAARAEIAAMKAAKGGRPKKIAA